ncbi:glycosyltransferase family 39 protein [bacterium]|nr:glycosyltransferase family 39 protein [bacterium]
MKKLKPTRTESIFFIFLLLVSFLLRFWGLGYSDFYGDETKTFYLDKTTPASQFFIDQRKGPLQFFVVWTTEKILGGHNEFWTRLPFAVAGFLSVIVFYYIVRRLFGWRAALVSAWLFSVSGFFVAFSRTIQYQSILLFFGLLAVCLFLERLYLFSSIALVLAFYAHYDAVFFFIPIMYLILKSDLRKSWKEVLTSFLIPFLVLVGIFYVPYILSGYLETNTVGYLERRFLGRDYVLNHSLYTLFIYNPTVLFFITSLTFIFSLFWADKNGHRDLILFWLFVPLLVFELLILNPGTHILGYLIPLLVLVGYVFTKLQSISKFVTNVTFGFLIFCITITSFRTFVPAFEYDYPWANLETRKYHLFLYGFPYNRGWNQISKYFNDLRTSGERVTGVFTNDNDTIAEYYLMGFDYTPPGSNFRPQYYIHVYNNQEFGVKDEKWYELFFVDYSLEKEFFVKGRLVAEVYKMKPL